MDGNLSPQDLRFALPGANPEKTEQEIMRRESDLMRRESDLMRRESDLMRRESDHPTPLLIGRRRRSDPESPITLCILTSPETIKKVPRRKTGTPDRYASDVVMCVRCGRASVHLW
ncbi:hypothetical protein [Methanofollis ethanolicus]|uniref:hypothetical protein n=1 Tax=Methanofollis ethanolicus TaxID=488124 RepID=UPI00128F54AC|nr:hypothetical protein [Methanofollis ethanolicus]